LSLQIAPNTPQSSNLQPHRSHSNRHFYLLALVLLLLCAVPSLAQQKSRTIEGTVSTKAGALVSGAIVYLKNNATLSVKSYITTADGVYRFGQVPMDADFQVWAESNGQKTATKTISAFDSKQNWTIQLRLSDK
jgi:Carboxypeptidase regulatory-like domain